jgi:hypothetical protein
LAAQPAQLANAVKRISSRVMLQISRIKKPPPTSKAAGGGESLAKIRRLKGSD